MAKKKLLFILVLLLGFQVRADEVELRVFISSSMPLLSIKEYFSDSARYKAVLVINGLPEGSFKTLSKLVMDIGGEKEGNLVIDSEAFEKFNIKQVPTIVLSKGDKFDVIYGNVGLKFALEEIIKNGELGEEARQILNNR